MSTDPSRHSVGGPWFDDLEVGQVFDTAPAITLHEGLAAAHQAIVGDRLRLSLDRELALSVTGASHVPPAMVWNIAIGQSTVVTPRVKANLFYRGLRLRRFPAFGDVLHTRTEVVGLRQHGVRPGRPETGAVALRITTANHNGEAVLDFWRCAMLPRDPARAGTDSGRHDDLSGIGMAARPLWEVPPGWDLGRYRDAIAGPHFDPAWAGSEWIVDADDVVSGAPELARLTLNIAAVHHDDRAGAGERLVYGGHTIALALGQICRAFPNLVTVLGWHSCDHTGPVREGDTLTSVIGVERAQPLGANSVALHLRSIVSTAGRVVLDWRVVVLSAR